VDDGIRVRLVEFHLVHHCNLTCSGCSHFSPSAPKHVVPPHDLAAQFALAAAHLDPEFVHLLGGEPLLHPHLLEVLKSARQSFPAATIKLVSNGLLVARRGVPLALTLAANNIVLAVSLYPLVPVHRATISALMAATGAEVEFWRQDTFLDFLDPEGSEDSRAARAACPMGDALNVRDDRVYPCPVSAWSDFGGVPLVEEDGIRLADPPETVRAVLDPTRVTSKCRYCRCVPPRRPHAMGSRRPALAAGVTAHD
jgi:cyclic pyranopterin phosphate synthase